MKLGRNPRTFDPRVPHLSALRLGVPAPAEPLVPAAIDWTQGINQDDLGMMMNDQLGDCTCAAYYHAIQVWSRQTNKVDGMITEPDGDALALYEAVGGYRPGDETTDNGAVEQDVLSYLLNTGAPTGPEGQTRHRLLAYVELDPRNHVDIQAAIAGSGVVYLGFDVPNYLMQPPGPPQLWDWQPSADTSSAGGHAIIAAGYDSSGLKIISWGQLYTMTWTFWDQRVDEAYSLVDRDWVLTTGRTPAGISVPALEKAMDAIRLEAPTPA